MNPHVELGFQLANEHAKQLITLSTGVLAITITFLGSRPFLTARWRQWLIATWVSHTISAVAGVCAMSALTGQLMPGGGLKPELADIGGLARAFSAIQFISFLAGTFAMLVFGIRVLPHALAPGSPGAAAAALRAHPRVVLDIVPLAGAAAEAEERRSVRWRWGILRRRREGRWKRGPLPDHGRPPVHPAGSRAEE
ncbi:MAG TPA: hypothetical protein VLK66_21755 [Longimicrobium sp.]|nr:hypothetical protein [Longimicrobium sp.]